MCLGCDTDNDYLLGKKKKMVKYNVHLQLLYELLELLFVPDHSNLFVKRKSGSPYSALPVLIQ